jgi:hypothetical protein
VFARRPQKFLDESFAIRTLTLVMNAVVYLQITTGAQAGKLARSFVLTVLRHI